MFQEQGTIYNKMWLISLDHKDIAIISLPKYFFSPLKVIIRPSAKKEISSPTCSAIETFWRFFKLNIEIFFSGFDAGSLACVSSLMVGGEPTREMA